MENKRIIVWIAVATIFVTVLMSIGCIEAPGKIGQKTTTMSVGEGEQVSVFSEYDLEVIEIISDYKAEIAVYKKNESEPFGQTYLEFGFPVEIDKLNIELEKINREEAYITMIICKPKDISDLPELPFVN